MGMQGTRAGTRAGIKPHLNWSGNSSSNKDNAQHATSMVDKTAVIDAHAASKIKFAGSSATEPMHAHNCSSCEAAGSVCWQQRQTSSRIIESQHSLASSSHRLCLVMRLKPRASELCRTIPYVVSSMPFWVATRLRE